MAYTSGSRQPGSSRRSTGRRVLCADVLPDPAAACNTPLLVQNYAEAVGAVGYSDDFAAYTLCESISVNFQVVNTAPLVFINVLDPKRHSRNLEETEAAVEEGVALLEVPGVLPGTLKVTNGAAVLERDVDYTTLFNSDGTLSIVLLDSGAGAGASTVRVSGKVLDPGMVTPGDIIGGVDVNTGKETGLEVIRQIYPKLAMTPGILLAPRFSTNPNVSAALQAKTKDINGVFKAVTIIDIDSSKEGATKYTDVKEQKEKQEEKEEEEEEEEKKKEKKEFHRTVGDRG